MFRYSAFAASFCVLAACQGPSTGTEQPDATVARADASVIASGGSVAAGGTIAGGGSPATGGAAGGRSGSTGGTAASGGTGVPTGGGLASGGAKGSGGATSGSGGSGVGGETASGGRSGTGGSAIGGAATGGTGRGGTTGMGGATELGGATGMGGATGSGGASASGGATSAGCTAPPSASPLVGWATQGSGTTGGGSATPVTVTTLSALQSAVQGTGAAVIYVKGVMAAGKLTVGSNKTIAGVCGAEIHGHIEMSGSVNVIIRNIKIVGYAVGNCALDPGYDSSVGCSSGDDAISLQKSAHNVWFDHCDISDGTDGNLDITNGAYFVTVSWTKFHYTPRSDNSGSDSTGASGHRFSNLVGGDDGTTSDAGKLSITWHHNWWADNVMERQPRVRFGQNHIFNNLYTATGDNYCVRAGIQAQILLEDNAFVGVKNPVQFNNTSDQTTAYITSNGNLFSGTSGTQVDKGGGTPFTTPPYTYTPDATAGLQAAVQSGAGPK